ncbi:DegT/DnrJ/EryC1/StrS family aminotransferase [Blastococcus sp. CT_GayMR20]|uniref:DegT/DnrJ/EryC1/StrS family aminotransferase n=1 Tax=Blastococcus sp. CT_GayMR20 TaxID=2559609 RepID=UPI0010748EF6|nr:DegT/DnrJ/EryC1/StrS family aminotransferase [Blastococcus sp. CT_GayMR20]TFV83259.1 DegT/DnrJ/EryC1/StrS family aminotransferase [Blastococcus sp. CT_GayMR20]
MTALPITQTRTVKVAEPRLGGNEQRYVQECMESTWISSAGRFIDLFEQRFAEVAGTKHAVATNNGTTALHLALAALGVGPGDEVIVPSLTYIATANAVKYCGAVPVLADVDPVTMCIDPADVARRITRRTVAVIPVHLYGHPADMTDLRQLADRHGLALVEDAAEAHTATWEGRPVGSLGTAGVFSFFGNKVLTTGEGGAVTTDDDALAARLRLLRGQGMDPQRRYWFPEVGFNYRMTNIAAAIGCAQLEQLSEFLLRRQEVAERYDAHLAGVPGIQTPLTDPRATRVNWLYTVLLPEHTTMAERDGMIDALAMDGIETRPVFHPMHTLPPYLQEDTFPVSGMLGRRGISLPTHVNLRDDDIDHVAERFLARLAPLRLR